MSKPSEIFETVRACLNMREPFFLKGGVGIGKSQIVKAACDDLGYEFVDVRMSQMDPTDIKGFPCPDAAKGVMRWLQPSFFPSAKAKTKGLIFMDELNSAPQAVQAAGYQLTLDFRVGDYVLPPGWTVGAAGNRDIDRSIVNRMPAALANRLIQLELESDLEEHVAHSRKCGISDDNIAFLRFRSALLHSFDAAQNPAAFPTPRSWFKVDKIMKQKLRPAAEFALICGAVGEAAAREHRAFIAIQKELPTADEIRLAPDTTAVPKQPAAMYATTTMLGSATTKAKFASFLQYISRAEKEWQVVYIRDALRVANEVKLTPEFTKWSLANADVILP